MAKATLTWTNPEIRLIREQLDSAIADIAREPE